MPTADDLWTPHDSAAATAQGYDLFATLLPECPVEVMMLQRDDEADLFPDDHAALRYVTEKAAQGDLLAMKALYYNNTPAGLEVEPFPEPTGDRPTVIDNAEVFDSDGTLALQIGDYDILYLSKCRTEGEDYPKLNDDDHQKIIDVIVAALKVGTPTTATPGPMDRQRFDLNQRQVEIVRIALTSASGNINDINDAMEEGQTPLNQFDVSGTLAVFGDAVPLTAKSRADKLFDAAVEGLTEYYPALKRPEIVAEIKGKVEVPDTGNDQTDYETVRDRVETLANAVPNEE